MSNTPLGTLAPMFLNSWGFFRYLTMSSISSLYSSIPKVRVGGGCTYYVGEFGVCFLDFDVFVPHVIVFESNVHHIV